MFISLLVPLLAFASTQYRIEMKYFLDGKLVSSPAVVVNEGKTAEISDMSTDSRNGIFLSVRPEGTGLNQVRLSLVLGKIAGGERVVLARPEIVALEKEEAAMEVGDRDRDGRVVNSYRITARVTEE